MTKTNARVVFSATLDTSLLPTLPEGYNLTAPGAKHDRGMGVVTVEKRKDGKLYVNNQLVVRYLSPNQQGGQTIRGHELRLELEREGEPSCLNATFRDFLLASQEFIPEDWDGWTYFWDTIAAGPVGGLCVACLGRLGRRWCGCWLWLGGCWDSRRSAARLASI